MTANLLTNRYVQIEFRPDAVGVEYLRALANTIEAELAGPSSSDDGDVFDDPAVLNYGHELELALDDLQELRELDEPARHPNPRWARRATFKRLL